MQKEKGVYMYVKPMQRRVGRKTVQIQSFLHEHFISCRVQSGPVLGCLHDACRAQLWKSKYAGWAQKMFSCLACTQPMVRFSVIVNIMCSGGVEQCWWNGGESHSRPSFISWGRRRQGKMFTVTRRTIRGHFEALKKQKRQFTKVVHVCCSRLTANEWLLAKWVAYKQNFSLIASICIRGGHAGLLKSSSGNRWSVSIQRRKNLCLEFVYILPSAFGNGGGPTIDSWPDQLPV